MKEKKTNSIFGFGKGWGIIIFCILSYFFYGGMNTDGLNVTVPLCAENIGVEQGVLFTLVSYSAFIGVLIHILWGQVVRRIGPRFTVGICLMIGGAAYILQANATTIPVFIISTALVYGCMMNAAFMGGGILVANYFPKRKGLVMGYTTMGLNLTSVIYVAILTALVAALGGGRMGVVPIAIATILLGVVCLAFVRSTPQEIGMYPDNVSREEYETSYDATESVADDGTWTTKKLLFNPTMWGVAITTGIFNITTGCVMSNMVARNMELGMNQARAVGTMSVVALIGIFGSWLIGVFDEKCGTKRTMIGFGIFYFVATFMNFLASMLGSSIPMYISILMIGIGIGGSANFTTSLAAQVFGRHSFDKVNSVLFPCQALITAMNFFVSGILRIITGNNLQWIFLCSGLISLINIPLILLLVRDEHKYNRDWIAGAAK